MDSTKARQEMKYIEANGCCFNIDEKMKFGFALEELANDLKLSKVWLVGKIQGKSHYLITVISALYLFAHSVTNRTFSSYRNR